MDPNFSQELLLVDVVAREELVLTDVVAPGASYALPLLRLDAKDACNVCKSRNRPLWQGVCAWCCADEETHPGR